MSPVCKISPNHESNLHVIHDVHVQRKVLQLLYVSITMESTEDCRNDRAAVEITSGWMQSAGQRCSSSRLIAMRSQAADTGQGNWATAATVIVRCDRRGGGECTDVSVFPSTRPRLGRSLISYRMPFVCTCNKRYI